MVGYNVASFATLVAATSTGAFYSTKLVVLCGNPRTETRSIRLRI